MSEHGPVDPLSAEGILVALIRGAAPAPESEPLPERATPRQLMSAIAFALWGVSARSLADDCDDYGIPRRDGIDDPMSGKVRYVEARLRGLQFHQLVDIGRRVAADHPNLRLTHLLNLAGARDATGAVRNVIFAADGPKPNIVVQDAISNVLQITEGGDRCLMYDQPIGDGGLSWDVLTSWWAARENLGAASPREQATSLYRRLLASLDNDAERVMFDTYCALYGVHGHDLPALLPQVYMHYDPHPKGRGATLVRQRMDFLLLLPGRRRIVFELDGVQHYADLKRGSCGHHAARPTKYAEMVREDRKLRLEGYEVYRFGGAELEDRKAAGSMLTAFYVELLDLAEREKLPR